MKKIFISLLSVSLLTSCMEYENGVNDYDTEPTDPIFNPSGTKSLKTYSTNTTIDSEIEIPSTGQTVSIGQEVSTTVNFSADYSLIELNSNSSSSIDFLGQVQESTIEIMGRTLLSDYKMQSRTINTSMQGQSLNTAESFTWTNNMPTGIEYTAEDTSFTSDIVYNGDVATMTKTNSATDITTLDIDLANQQINSITVSNDNYSYDIIIELNYNGFNLTTTTISTTDGAFNDSYNYTYDSKINPFNIYSEDQNNIKLGNSILEIATIDFDLLENQFNANVLEIKLRPISNIAENNLLKVEREDSELLSTTLTYDSDEHPESGTQVMLSVQENLIDLPAVLEIEPLEANTTLEYTYYE